MENRKRVWWSAAEWQKLAIELIKANPALLHESTLRVDPADLRKAMAAALPMGRQRPVHAGTAPFRAGLNQAFLAERAHHVGDNPAFKDAAPSSKRAHSLTPLTVTVTSRRSAHYVVWNSKELFEMAAFLRDRYPFASYINSTSAAGLSLDDVKEAMRSVLDTNRRRPIKAIDAALRRRFAIAFKDARLAASRIGEQAEGRPATPSKPQVQTQKPRKDEHESLAVQTPNPYEAAFGPLLKPLAALFAKELFDALTPQIEQLLLDAAASVSAGPGGATSTAAPTGEQGYSIAGSNLKSMANCSLPPTTHQTESALLRPLNSLAAPEIGKLVCKTQHPLASRKKIIGIVGPLPIQANDIAAAFPQFEFLCVDGSQASQYITSMLVSATRVIGMTKFMRHSIDGALFKRFGQRYVRVTGGVSMIKRQISLWVSSGSPDLTDQRSQQEAGDLGASI